MLKNKTRILVTHGVTNLAQMDRIIHLENGEICEIGTFSELLSKKGKFAMFYLQHASNDSDTSNEPKSESLCRGLDNEVICTVKNISSGLKKMNLNGNNDIADISQDKQMFWGGWEINYS